MVWVGRDLKNHLVPTLLPWGVQEQGVLAGAPSTRPGYS